MDEMQMTTVEIDVTVVLRAARFQLLENMTYEFH